MQEADLVPIAARHVIQPPPFVRACDMRFPDQNSRSHIPQVYNA